MSQYLWQAIKRKLMKKNKNKSKNNLGVLGLLTFPPPPPPHFWLCILITYESPWQFKKYSAVHENKNTKKISGWLDYVG